MENSPSHPTNTFMLHSFPSNTCLGLPYQWNKPTVPTVTKTLATANCADCKIIRKLSAQMKH